MKIAGCSYKRTINDVVIEIFKCDNGLCDLGIYKKQESSIIEKEDLKTISEMSINDVEKIHLALGELLIELRK